MVVHVVTIELVGVQSVVGITESVGVQSVVGSVHATESVGGFGSVHNVAGSVSTINSVGLQTFDGSGQCKTSSTMVGSILAKSPAISVGSVVPSKVLTLLWVWI